MAKNKNRIVEISQAVIRNTGVELTKILDIKDIDLKYIFSYIDNLSDRDKNTVIISTINQLLETLKSRLTIDLYKRIVNNVNMIMDYINTIQDLHFNVYEVNDIADDFLFQVIENHQFELPISLSCIKKFCLLKGMNQDQQYDTFIWLIIRYVAIDRCISCQNYLDDIQKIE